METDSYFSRFLWGARQESAEVCAEHLSEFLRQLKSVDRGLAKWQIEGNGDFHPVLPEAEALVPWLNRGVNRADIGKRVIPELGFMATLMPVARQPSILLSVNCGVYSKWNPNVCAISFVKHAVADRLLQTAVLLRLARVIINCWQPEHGLITTYESCEILGTETGDSEVGWMTYFSDKYPVGAKLATKFPAERIGDGWLIVATQDRFSSSNRDQMKIVKQISRLVIKG